MTTFASARATTLPELGLKESELDFLVDMVLASGKLEATPDLVFIARHAYAQGVAAAQDTTEGLRTVIAARDRDIAMVKHSLSLAYKCREALGWNDKTDLSIMPDEIRRIRRALDEAGQWRARESETQEALQAIGEEFGFFGGEPRVAAVQRVLKEQRAKLEEAEKEARLRDQQLSEFAERTGSDIGVLRAEILGLRAEIDQASGVIADRNTENAALEAKLANTTEALGFYANPSIYEPHPHGPAFDRRDLSATAKAALAELGGPAR